MGSFYRLYSKEGEDLGLSNETTGHACTTGLGFAQSSLVSIFHPDKSLLSEEGRTACEEVVRECCNLYPWLPEWGKDYTWGEIIDMKGKNLQELHMFILYCRLFWEYDWKRLLELREKYGIKKALVLFGSPFDAHYITSASASDTKKEYEWLLFPERWKAGAEPVLCGNLITFLRGYMRYFAGPLKHTPWAQALRGLSVEDRLAIIERDIV